MVKRGLFIGRFQPIHKGHIKAIKEILKQVDEIIIVVGSAQCSHSFSNPFTAGERITFIKKALDENHIDPNRYYIIPVPDTNDNRLWVSHLVSLTPSFEIVFSNNPLVRRLLIESDYKTGEIQLFERKKYTATLIRTAIIEGTPWEELVPPSVAKFIKDIGGIERIKAIGETKLKL
ncbi:MAG: nicotinamide-nucleotide adenylyltransferase [Candidatus Hodarchaeota archaeon]